MTSNRTNEKNKLINTAVGSVVEGALHTASHEAEKHIQGLGKYYLNPKLKTISLTHDFYHRATNTDNPSETTGEKLTCAAVGTSTKALTNYAGGKVLIAAAPETLGASLLGFTALEAVSTLSGNGAEKLCHKTHELAREIKNDKNKKPITYDPSVISSTSPLSAVMQVNNQRYLHDMSFKSDTQNSISHNLSKSTFANSQKSKSHKQDFKKVKKDFCSKTEFNKAEIFFDKYATKLATLVKENNNSKLNKFNDIKTLNDEAYRTLSYIGEIGEMFKDKHLRKIAEKGLPIVQKIDEAVKAGTSLVSGITSLASGNPLGLVNIFESITHFGKLFGKRKKKNEKNNKKDPSSQIISAICESHKLLAEELHQVAKSVHEHLHTIHSDMLKGFDYLGKNIQQMHADMVHGFAYLGQGIEEIYKNIDDLKKLVGIVIDGLEGIIQGQNDNFEIIINKLEKFSKDFSYVKTVLEELGSKVEKNAFQDYRKAIYLGNYLLRDDYTITDDTPKELNSVLKKYLFWLLSELKEYSGSELSLFKNELELYQKLNKRSEFITSNNSSKIITGFLIDSAQAIIKKESRDSKDEKGEEKQHDYKDVGPVIDVQEDNQPDDKYRFNEALFIPMCFRLIEIFYKFPDLLLSKIKFIDDLIEVLENQLEEVKQSRHEKVIKYFQERYNNFIIDQVKNEINIQLEKQALVLQRDMQKRLPNAGKLNLADNVNKIMSDWQYGDIVTYMWGKNHPYNNTSVSNYSHRIPSEYSLGLGLWEEIKETIFLSYFAPANAHTESDELLSGRLQVEKEIYLPQQMLLANETNPLILGIDHYTCTGYHPMKVGGLSRIEGNWSTRRFDPRNIQYSACNENNLIRMKKWNAYKIISFQKTAIEAAKKSFNDNLFQICNGLRTWFKDYLFLIKFKEIDIIQYEAKIWSADQIIQYFDLFLNNVSSENRLDVPSVFGPELSSTCTDIINKIKGDVRYFEIDEKSTLISELKKLKAFLATREFEKAQTKEHNQKKFEKLQDMSFNHAKNITMFGTAANINSQTDEKKAAYSLQFTNL